ncbi:hypothetical protein QTP88_010603 [Uroleucon formosanum]
MEDNSTFAEATLINPRFKKKGFSSETYYIRTYQNVVNKISSIIKHKKQSMNQEENIITDEEQITMSTEKKETFEIWKEFDSQGVLSTSVPCERTFSKAGYIQTDRCNRLSTKKKNGNIDVFKWQSIIHILVNGISVPPPGNNRAHAL